MQGQANLGAAAKCSHLQEGEDPIQIAPWEPTDANLLGKPWWPEPGTSFLPLASKGTAMNSALLKSLSNALGLKLRGNQRLLIAWENSY